MESEYVALLVMSKEIIIHLIVSLACMFVLFIPVAHPSIRDLNIPSSYQQR